MGTPYEIGLCGELGSDITSACKQNLNFTSLQPQKLVPDKLRDKKFDAILLCLPENTSEGLSLLLKLTEMEDESIPPCLVIIHAADVDTKVTLLNAGADDVIESTSTAPELLSRINKAITNHVANRQLKSQLTLANQIAMSAMTDTSDLGNNNQFLVNAGQCDNFDQLGQRLFQALDYYGLNCSLQIRGRFEDKNMERSGLARELEAQLLSHFQAAGRFHQSGKRLFCNYGSASLLIKNLPVEDEVRCGKIRDNIFTLMQGMDTRINALDDKTEAELKMRLLQDLTGRMKQTLLKIEESFLAITDDIVQVTEQTNEQVTNALNYLGLSENQEQAICDIMNELITNTNAIFNRGLKINEQHRHFFDKIDDIMQSPGDNQLEAMAALKSLL